MSTARHSQSVCQARGGRRARFLRNRRASPAGESWRNARQPLDSTSLPSSTYAARPMALHFVCEGHRLGGLCRSCESTLCGIRRARPAPFESVVRSECGVGETLQESSTELVDVVRDDSPPLAGRSLMPQRFPAHRPAVHGLESLEQDISTFATATALIEGAHDETEALKVVQSRLQVRRLDLRVWLHIALLQSREPNLAADSTCMPAM